MSYIRSVDQFGGMMWQPGARRVWADNVQVTMQGPGADQALRISADLHALDYAGREGRLLAYAYDSVKRSPWSPAEPTFTGGSAGNLLKAPNGQLVLRTDFSVGQPVETGRGISMDVPSSVVGGDPKHLVFRLLLWDAAQAQALWRGAEWLKVQPAAEAETPTPVSPIATQVPPTATPVPPSPTPVPPTATRVLPTPTLAPGATRISDKDGMVMVYVPAGEFLMGSTDAEIEASDDEQPQHKVYLDAFWIDRTEVTKAQYQQCVEARKCAAPGCSGTGQGDHPVVCVSWNNASNYCAWVERRLPTEAEWEKAARGMDGRRYPWGNEAVAGNLLNFCDRNCGYTWKDTAVDDGYAETAPVGSYPAGASVYDALDMAGNVWEWVADWYDEKYYASSPAQNPIGPESGQIHVMRGGSWGYNQRVVRAAYRNRGVPVFGFDVVGFRCARSQ